MKITTLQLYNLSLIHGPMLSSTLEQAQGHSMTMTSQAAGAIEEEAVVLTMSKSASASSPVSLSATGDCTVASEDYKIDRKMWTIGQIET